MGHSYVPRNPRGQQRDKMFREALRLQLAKRGEDLKALREIADGLIDKALAADLQAIKEVRDTLDGKPAQMLEHTGNDGKPIGRITVEFVHRNEPEPEPIDADYQEVRAIDGNGHAAD